MKIVLNRESFSKKIATKTLLVFMATLIAIGVPMTMVQKVSADQYDDRIAALQQQIDGYNGQAAQLAEQSRTLQSAVAVLQGQAAVIQAQIDISQAKHDKLVVQIADTEKQIKDSQDALGKTIANMYVDDKITPLEMLASSKSIGDYLDKQEYRSSVRTQLTSTITRIKDLKVQLDKQRADVEKTLGDQTNAKNALVTKQQEQQNLLNQTQGQEAAYQQLIASSATKQQQIRDEKQAAIAAAYNTGGARLIKGGVDGGYPWNESNCRMASFYSLDGSDGNGGDGHSYGCRQCASYAAWKVAKEIGYYPENWGNASDFPSSARAVGYQTSSTPRANSLAVMHAYADGIDFGHVVWVDSVNDDGTITVEQYNYNYGAGWGMYSQMKLSAATFWSYIYIN